MPIKSPIVCFILNNDINYQKYVENKVFILKEFIDAIKTYTKNVYSSYDTVNLFAGRVENVGTYSNETCQNDIRINQISFYDLYVQQISLLMKLINFVRYMINPNENKQLIEKAEAIYQKLYIYLIATFNKNDLLMDINELINKSMDEKQKYFDFLIKYMENNARHYDPFLNKIIKKQYHILSDIYKSELTKTIDEFDEENNFITEIIEDIAISLITNTVLGFCNSVKCDGRPTFIIIKKKYFKAIQKAVYVIGDAKFSFHIINNLYDLKRLEKSESLKLINTHI
jgi:hypothetical protein